MITCHRKYLEERCLERGFALADAMRCVVSTDGDMWTVDVNHASYPHGVGALSFICVPDCTTPEFACPTGECCIENLNDGTNSCMQCSSSSSVITACESLLITYDWTENGSSDLDTATTFLGATVGWSCGGGNQYISWSGDNTSQSSTETATINLKSALDAGLWSGSVTVDLAAGWYSPAGGSGPITIKVSCGGTEQTKQANPGSQDTCASASVGSVAVNENGTFTLN